jgi:hypothetical protein
MVDVVDINQLEIESHYFTVVMPITYFNMRCELFSYQKLTGFRAATLGSLCFVNVYLSKSYRDIGQ